MRFEYFSVMRFVMRIFVFFSFTTSLLSQIFFLIFEMIIFNIFFPLFFPKYSFADWKVLEAQFLALNGHNIRSVVIGSGIPYGNGDTVLRDYVRNAWSNPEKLKVIATGENILPMIHVRDLARLTRFVAFEPEEAGKTYYIATDGSDSTQRDLMLGLLNEFQVRFFLFKFFFHTLKRR